MDIEVFRKIIPQVAPITEQVCFHLMGEPLVHPKFEEMVEICAKENVPINLVSNGVLLTEKRMQMLLHPAFRQVNFSLHSFADNFPGKDPTEYLEKIFHFTELAFEKRPDLYLNYRLWNLQDTTQAQGGAMGANQEILARVENRFSWKLENKSGTNVINVREQKSVKIKNRLYLHFDTEFIWPSLDLPLLGEKGFCHGLSGHFGILAEGTVVPCCLDKEAKIPLGNIQDAPIAEILAGERAQKMLKGFRNRKLTEALCKRCNYIQRFD